MIRSEAEGFIEMEVSETHAVVCRVDQMQRNQPRCWFSNQGKMCWAWWLWKWIGRQNSENSKEYKYAGFGDFIILGGPRTNRYQAAVVL